MVVAAAVILAASVMWLWRAWTAYRHERAEFVDAPEAGQSQPPDAGDVRVRDVTWTIDGHGPQHAWFVPSQNGALVVFVHGSPGSRMSLWPQALDLATRGYGVLLPDLPGYGRSAGIRRWDDTFEKSLRAAVDFAAEQPSVDPHRIAGFGFSMGACLVARVAADDQRIAALLLLAPFTNLREQLHHQFRSRWPGVSSMAIFAARQVGVPVDRLDTAQALRRLGDRPVLLVGGRRDPVIPPAMVEALGRSSPHATTLIVDDMGHGWMEEQRPFPMARIQTFLEKALQPGTRLRALPAL